MTKPKNPAAVALGKLTSPRKAESSRQNGNKGGRPKKDAQEIVKEAFDNLTAKRYRKIMREIGIEVED